MDLLSARRMARQLMNDHGLADWRFMWDSASRRFGACHYARQAISLSRILTQLNDEPQVRDTILHEIAHALTPGDGHGAKWRATCAQIGALPERCYRDEEVVAPARAAAKYLYGCVTCDWWVPRRRVTGRRFVCARCRRRLAYRHHTPDGTAQCPSR